MHGTGHEKRAFPSFEHHSPDAMSTAKPSHHFGIMVGNSPVMQQLVRQVDKVSATDATVLLVGESGTGKEVVAHAIHQASNRSRQAFVAVNCGAIPAHLIEAALFGHERGSFTGAARQHLGYFEHASGGTLFLDEITEMPLEMQVKLLRVLESGSFLRVGGDEEVKVDVRLIAATNRDLETAVAQGNLREDLMYRLAVFPVSVPPLRERGSDIELLAQHFLSELNAKSHTNKTFSKASLDAIRSYSWPGNVRELENAMERAVILTPGRTIQAAALPERVTERRAEPLVTDRPPPTPTLDAIERAYIVWVLQNEGGNKARAAEVLGIDPSTLYRKLARYGDS